MRTITRTVAPLAFLLALGACGGQADSNAPSSAASATAFAAASATASPTAAGATEDATPSASTTEDPAPSASTTKDPAGAPADSNVTTVNGVEVVSGDNVAASVNTELTKIVGRSPDDVTCPDLPAKVGASIRCTLTDGSSVYGVAITATSVVADSVQFSIQVDDQPQ